MLQTEKNTKRGLGGYLGSCICGHWPRVLLESSIQTSWSFFFPKELSGNVCHVMYCAHIYIELFF